jgi:16S rRNA (cytosine967-C5)-methyltransferase
VLDAVLTRRQPFDTALAGHRNFTMLSPRDRAFARLLIVTVLRRLGEIDGRLDRLLRHPLPEKAGRAQNVLRLGVAQLAYLGTPPHAAVDTAVRLLEKSFPHLKGVANAILRKVAPDPAADPPAGINTPAWLWDSWLNAYGAATAAAIAAAHLTEPPLDISVASDPDSWAEQLEAELLPTGSLRRSAGGNPALLPGFDEGAWWVQDAAATLPAILFGDVADKSVVDLCAAPGGKTAQLAAAGAQVTAVDRSQQRLKRLGENLQRLSLQAEVVEADAVVWRPATPAAAVLLDAPCTATGTIRRHPDIAHLKTPDDVVRLSALQDRLLRAAVSMAAPGGQIVYATCSLQPEEGPDRIKTVLEDDTPVVLDPITDTEVPGLDAAVQPDGTLRTLPCHWSERGGLDGFFIARLRRT